MFWVSLLLHQFEHFVVYIVFCDGIKIFFRSGLLTYFVFFVTDTNYHFFHWISGKSKLFWNQINCPWAGFREGYSQDTTRCTGEVLKWNVHHLQFLNKYPINFILNDFFLEKGERWCQGYKCSSNYVVASGTGNFRLWFSIAVLLIYIYSFCTIKLIHDGVCWVLGSEMEIFQVL